MKDFDQYLSSAKTFIFSYGVKVLLALIVLVLGLKVIKLFMVGFKRWINQRDVDESLKPFLTSFLSAVLKTALFISVLSMVGIATTSFVAILGSAGLAIGLALQGSFANFAGGVMILLFKPFDLEDFIEAQGFMGTVKEIKIFCTILNTPDNKRIIIPNGPLASGAMINYSSEKTRRVDLVIGIGYGDDLKKAKTILEDILNSDARVLKEPAFLVAVSELGDSSVNFKVRPWCLSSDYWDLYSDILETTKLRFDQEGISIPYPQMDIHFQKETLKTLESHS